MSVSDAVSSQGEKAGIISLPWRYSLVLLHSLTLCLIGGIITFKPDNVATISGGALIVVCNDHSASSDIASKLFGYQLFMEHLANRSSIDLHSSATSARAC